VPTGFSHACLINVQMNPNGMITINALPVQMSLMDREVSTYRALLLYKTEIHAVNYSMKYLCGEGLFCTLFIMKGMPT
jgi:hypothetical protein